MYKRTIHVKISLILAWQFRERFMEVLHMTERLTWKEIQEKYPDQWVGLDEVEYMPHNTATIKSAIVKYIGMSKDELGHRMMQGEIISRYTTPDNLFQLGMVGVHG